MACLLLLLLSSLALGIHSEIKQEVAETVHFVESNWSADDTVPPEKLVLICNISQEEADSVYWTKNQKWQGNGKHLQITVQEPPDAGNYFCWSNTTHELLTNATVYLTKIYPSGEIANPILRRLPVQEPPDAGNYFCWSNTTHELLTNATVYLTKIYPSGEIANPILRRLPESKIYFKCTANNYSGIFTCIWISAIKETELMFKIGSHMKSQGNASEEIVCDEPVNDSSERNLKRYSASCRKQNSTCPSTEEYQPIEMVLQVFHGFVYEDHRHTFFIKDILKPDISECYNNKGLLTWTPPQTWSTPISYYGLTYQIKMHGQICEVSSATILQNENTLSCYNRRCSRETCVIRSRDRYNINSAWSNWSSCNNGMNDKPSHHRHEDKAKIEPCKCQKN
nr:interleukin-12 subunit beta [Pogona vitticeps]